VQINLPHPRHDDFLDDPTHVRAVTPGMLSLFSKNMNRLYAKHGYSNSPLGIYWDIDFEIKNVEYGLDPAYQARFAGGQLSREEIDILSRERNNVVREIRILIVAVK
jgi:hypothetical protein